MKDEKREYSIIVYRNKDADGELYDNLEATSMFIVDPTSASGRGQIHCDLKRVKWLEVIARLRKLELSQSDNIDLIEGYLKEGDMGQLKPRCTAHDLEAIGFICP